MTCTSRNVHAARAAAWWSLTVIASALGLGYGLGLVVASAHAITQGTHMARQKIAVDTFVLVLTAVLH